MIHPLITRLRKYAAKALPALAFAAMVITSSATAQAQDYTSDLLNHWTLDETSGTSVADSVGTATGTWSGGGSVSSITGQVGTGFNFDGSHNVSNMNTADFTNGQSITIAMWLKPPSTPSDWQVVISKPGSGSFGHFYLETYTNDRLYFGYNGTGNSDHEYLSCATCKVNPGVWTHIAVTYTFGTGSSMKMYFNGVEGAAGTWNFGNGNAAPTPSTGNMELSLTSWGYVGDMDDVRIYNRALSAADIAALYNHTNQGRIIYNTDYSTLQYYNGTDWIRMGSEPVQTTETLTPIHRWTMDDTNTTAIDIIGGNNGTMSGGLDGASDSVTGYIDQALTFSGGVDERLTIPYTSDMGLSEGTWSFWYKTDGTWGTDGSDASNSAVLLNQRDSSSNSGIAISFSGATTWIGTQAKNAGGASVCFAGANTATARDDNWHNITLTFSNALGANLIFYYDGTEIARCTNSAAWSFTGDAMLVGDGSTYYEEYGGEMDDIRIYDRILTPSQVKQLYGLKAYYKLDETAATTTATDSAGSHDGTMTSMTGAANTATGKISTALDFDGSADYIDAGTIDISGPVTLCAWANFDALPSNGNQINLVSNINGGSGTVQYELIIENSGGTYYLGQYWGTGWSLEGWGAPIPITTGSWTHLCASRVSDSEVKFYMNGDEYSSISFGNESIPTTGFSNTMIGGATGAFVNGRLDDVRMYNVALSGSEIRALYNQTNNYCTDAGKIIYNTDESEMQFCNGSTWISMEPHGVTNTTVSLSGDITSNLSGHWKFDDGSGTTAVDSSGNGRNMTLYNSPTWTSGMDAGALSFAPTDSYGLVSSPTSFNMGTADYTITAWVKRNGASGAGQTNILMKVNSDGTWAANGKALYVAEAGESRKITFDAYGIGTVQSNTSIDDNWHHIAVSFKDSSNTVKFYLDGKYDGSATLALTSDDATDVLATSFSSGPSPIIDDIRFYSRVLTDAEIAKVFLTTGGTGDTTTGLVTKWDFEEGAGTTTTDSQSGLVGTLTNGTTWTTGQVGDSAVSLDATDDIISVPANAALNFTGEITLSAWVYPNTIGAVSSGTYQDIIVKGNVGTGAHNWYLKIFEDEIQFGCNGAFTNCYGITSGVNLTAGQWYHIAATFIDATNTMAIYVNGVPATIGSSVLTGAMSSNSYGLIMGEFWSGEELDGRLDDVRVYSRALSAADIATLYGGGGGGNCTSPAGTPGMMIYNIDHSVMQYCNGTQWVGIENHGG